LPASLQTLIDQVTAEQISYSSCEVDAECLVSWLSKGDHSMAEFVTKQIQEGPQSPVRRCKSTMLSPLISP
jgi:hypothetical protein